MHSQLPVDFYGVLWASLQANELCWEHSLKIMGDQHMYTRMKELSFAETFVNLAECVCSVWLTKTFIPNFNKD